MLGTISISMVQDEEVKLGLPTTDTMGLSETLRIVTEDLASQITAIEPIVFLVFFSSGLCISLHVCTYLRFMRLIIGVMLLRTTMSYHCFSTIPMAGKILF